MGHTWSSRRRNNRHNHQTPPLSHPPSLNLPPPPPPPPPPPHPPTRPPPQPPSYAFAANAPYPSHPQNPYPILPCHPPHLSNSRYYSRPPLTPQSYFHPYFINQSNGFRPPPPPMPPPPPPPPPYVDHQSTKKIKNDVNVRKDSIRIEVDENNPEYHLVSFTFDAMVDGSITILYFGKEGANCTFTPLYPEIHMPVRISFQKGLGQKFCQPSGTGIDLGFFDKNDLSNPLSGEDVFPLVISAESNLPSSAKNNQLDDSVVTTATHAQITQAVLEKNDESHFQVKVIKQVLWMDGDRYELREIYGISSSNEATINDDSGKECVICMTEPKDTAVLPCRHMCMCSDCAKELRLQSNKCPVCRQPIQELMEIKVNEGQS